MRRILNSLKSKILGSGKPDVERRNVAEPTHRPKVGEFLVYHHLKLEITETKTHELLKWLLKHGWRTVTVKNDRRQYHVLPMDTYEKLDLAASSDRPMMIRAMMRQK